MRLDIQFKLKSNPYYSMYIREYPIWYKHLNRNPEMFKNFEDEVKKKYKLTMSDKISQISDQVSFIKEIMDIIN